MQLNVPEASRRLSLLIRAARAGEEVVIAENGEPVARLVPASPATASADEVGLGSTILAWLEQHPLAEAHRRPAAEIDAAIEAERAAWE